MARRICEAVKTAREVAGLTQRQLADMLGVSQPAIHNWEHDTEPSLDALAAVEDALGLRRGQLVRDAGYVDDDPPTIDDVIRSDDSLSPDDRRAVLDLVAFYRARGGRGES
jgi:transcriptional regulator with XRE-family HTH domain